jgi:hypothetical protein
MSEPSCPMLLKIHPSVFFKCHFYSGGTKANEYKTQIQAFIISLRNKVFWNVKICGLIDRYQHFTRTYCLYLQGYKSEPSSGKRYLRNTGKGVWKEEKVFTGLTHFSYPEDGGSRGLWNVEPLYHTARCHILTAILIFHHYKENLKSHLRKLWFLWYFPRICFGGIIWLML